MLRMVGETPALKLEVDESRTVTLPGGNKIEFGTLESVRAMIRIAIGDELVDEDDGTWLHGKWQTPVGVQRGPVDELVAACPLSHIGELPPEALADMALDAMALLLAEQRQDT